MNEHKQLLELIQQCLEINKIQQKLEPNTLQMLQKMSVAYAKKPPANLQKLLQIVQNLKGQFDSKSQVAHSRQQADTIVAPSMMSIDSNTSTYNKQSNIQTPPKPQLIGKTVIPESQNPKVNPLPLQISVIKPKPSNNTQNHIQNNNILQNPLKLCCQTSEQSLENLSIQSNYSAHPNQLSSNVQISQLPKQDGAQTPNYKSTAFSHFHIYSYLFGQDNAKLIEKAVQQQSMQDLYAAMLPNEELLQFETHIRNAERQQQMQIQEDTIEINQNVISKQSRERQEKFLKSQKQRVKMLEEKRKREEERRKELERIRKMNEENQKQMMVQKQEEKVVQNCDRAQSQREGNVLLLSKSSNDKANETLQQPKYICFDEESKTLLNQSIKQERMRDIQSINSEDVSFDVNYILSEQAEKQKYVKTGGNEQMLNFSRYGEKAKKDQIEKQEEKRKNSEKKQEIGSKSQVKDEVQNRMDKNKRDLDRLYDQLYERSIDSNLSQELNQLIMPPNIDKGKQRKQNINISKIPGIQDVSDIE